MKLGSSNPKGIHANLRLALVPMALTSTEFHFEFQPHKSPDSAQSDKLCQAGAVAIEQDSSPFSEH